VAVSYGSELKTVVEHGFTKYILNNVSFEDAQKSMIEEAEKIIKKNQK
jgi:multiple sugar transport system substrate-binding protein